MIQYTAEIGKFSEKGEKSGWTYIVIPSDIAEKIRPGQRKSFQVKGKLDNYAFEGVNLLPMGDGDFIMALNAAVRKAIKKQKGDTLKVQIAFDTKEKKLSSDFLECLEDAPEAKAFFDTLPKSHQKYYSNWIESAKTDATKTKRITMAINGFLRNMGFGEMLRENKKLNNRE